MKRNVSVDCKNGRIEKMVCIKCSHDTDHEVLSSIRVEYSNSEFTYWETFEILECRGCHEIAFKREAWDENDFAMDEDGEATVDSAVDIYPSRLVNRKKIDNEGGFGPVPKDVYAVYDEVYKALCARHVILCGAGLRILLERVCKDVDAKGKNLKKKINSLKEKGICSEADIQLLHGTRLFGNEIIHEGQPASSDLEAAFDVLEHLIKMVYVLPVKAAPLKKWKSKSINQKDISPKTNTDSTVIED